MKERIIAKRQKNSEQSEPNEEEQKMIAARKAERLDEENEIVITILSEIAGLPKEKIVYNYSEDISMTGTRIQGNVLLPIDTFLKIDVILKNLKQTITVFGKVKRNKVIIEGESYEAGVEFVDTPQESIKKLGNYISSMKQYKNLNPVGVPYWIFAKFNKPKSQIHWQSFKNERGVYVKDSKNLFCGFRHTSYRRFNIDDFEQTKSAGAPITLSHHPDHFRVRPDFIFHIEKQIRFVNLL